MEANGFKVDIAIISHDLIKKRLEHEDTEISEPHDFPRIEKIGFSYCHIVEISGLNDFASLTTLRLDNNHIKRIQGLSKCTNLRWLDLSFNEIERIEGLEALTKLEDLSLAHNKISVVEGLDNAKNLQVLSLAYNNITSMDCCLYLRQFQHLNLITLAGNPMSSDAEYLPFIIAHLPSVKYTDYRLISKEAREQAIESYRDELVDLQEKESMGALNPEEQERKDLEERADGLGVGALSALIYGELGNETETARTLKLTCVVGLFNDFLEDTSKRCLAYIDAIQEDDKVRKAEIREFEEGLRMTLEEAESETKRLIKSYVHAQKAAVQSYENITTQDDLNEALENIDSLIEMMDSLFDRLLSFEESAVMRVSKMMKAYEKNLAALVNSSIETTSLLFNEIRDEESKYHELALTEALALLEQYQLSLATLDEEISPAITALSDSAKALLKDRSSLQAVFQAAHDNRTMQIDGIEDGITNWLRMVLETEISRIQESERTRHRIRTTELSNWRDKTLEELNMLIQDEEEMEEEEGY